MRRLLLAPSNTAPEGEWLSVTAYLAPGSRQVRVALRQPGRQPAVRQVNLSLGRTLRLLRQGDAATVLWDQVPVFDVEGVGELRRVGLETDGPPVLVQSLQVRSPLVQDYMFGVAPTDWWASAGAWEVAARWACDPRWSWFAGWGEGEVVIWNKRRFPGDVVVDYYVGVKMNAPGGPETQRCRDLNTVLCGDRSDPHSGYSFILGGDGGVKTQLLRQGTVVAEHPHIRVPAGYSVHHRWFHVHAAKIGSSVELDFEGRPVFRYEDPDPLQGGYVGIWTRNSGILIPHVTIYDSGS